MLSFIHSTTSAEGSIKDVRNIVGSYSHSTSDDICTARLALMSAIRSSDSVCCFDYTQNIAKHRANWRASWKSTSGADLQNAVSDKFNNDDAKEINTSEEDSFEGSE